MANCHNSHMGLTATFPHSSSSWYAVVADAVVGRCAPLDTACTRDAPQLPAAKKRTTESVHAGSRETTRPRMRREHRHLRAYAAYHSHLRAYAACEQVLTLRVVAPGYAGLGYRI